MASIHTAFVGLSTLIAVAAYVRIFEPGTSATSQSTSQNATLEGQAHRVP